MNASIRNMNWTLTNREIEQKSASLTIMDELEFNQRQARIHSAHQEIVDIHLHKIVEICLKDPYHILNAEQFWTDDLGTHYTISGGEVMEVEHQTQNGGDMPF